MNNEKQLYLCHICAYRPQKPYRAGFEPYTIENMFKDDEEAMENGWRFITIIDGAGDDEVDAKIILCPRHSMTETMDVVGRRMKEIEFTRKI